MTKSERRKPLPKSKNKGGDKTNTKEDHKQRFEQLLDDSVFGISGKKPVTK